MTRRDAGDFAGETSPEARGLYGMLRRVLVTLTAKTRWQVRGHRRMLDNRPETADVETFPGVGFYARPAAGARTEAVLASIGAAEGGAACAVVIATRAEGTRRDAVGDGDADRTSMFNTQVIVDARPDATIEAKSIGGTAAPLATHADLEALKTAFDSWTPVPNDGGAALKTILDALIATGWPAGTSVLKGE